MTQIIIDVPEEIEQEAKMLNLKLSVLILKSAQEQIHKLKKIERIKRIAAKSQATDKDVEELSDKVDTAMLEYHKKKYNL